MKIDVVKVRISDQAFQELVNKGRTAEFVRSDVTTKGLSYYLTSLIQRNPLPANWEDTRPPGVRLSTPMMLEAGQFGVWDTGAQRIPRLLTLGEVTRQHICLLARELGVVRSSMNSAMRSLLPTALISEFLEAVGLKWLTPKVQPTPKYLSKKRVYDYELDW